MSLGLIPAIIGALAAVAPTVYSAVDAHNQKRRDDKQKLQDAIVAQQTAAGIPAISIPDQNPSAWDTWKMPVVVTGGVLLVGTIAFLTLREPTTQKKSRGRKRTKTRDEIDEED